MITPTFVMTLLTSVGFIHTTVSAQEKPPANKQLTLDLSGFVGTEKTDRVLSLMKDSKNDLEISFRKNPKREEAFLNLITGCIRLLDGVDFVPQSCVVLFGAFPEVDRVFNYVVQANLSAGQRPSTTFPPEFNNILNGLICGLCPTATCEVPNPEPCEQF